PRSPPAPRARVASAPSPPRRGASRPPATTGPPSAASGDGRPVAGGAIVVAGVDRHPKVWPSHIEDRRVAPGAASARRTGRTLRDVALVPAFAITHGSGRRRSPPDATRRQDHVPRPTSVCRSASG